MCRSKSKEIKHSLTWLIDALKFCLEAGLIDGKKFRIKSIELLNVETLVCKFFALSSDPVMIKGELYSIMKAMAHFLKEEFNQDFIKYYAVQAVDKDEDELFYAITSKMVALKNDPLEWSKSSQIVENTPEFRIGQAKRKISEIENASRSLICSILESKSSNWWNELVPEKSRERAEATFNQNTGSSSSNGKELINYTNLVDLFEILKHNWIFFKDIFPSISSKSVLKSTFGTLNNERKEEAHNRPISHVALKRIETIYDKLLGDIAQVIPDSVPEFMMQNWRISCRNVVTSYSQPLMPTGLPLDVVVEKIKVIMNNLHDVELKLDSISVPAGKRALHNELKSFFTRTRESYAKMLDHVSKGNVNGVVQESQVIPVIGKEMKYFQARLLFSETT